MYTDPKAPHQELTPEQRAILAAVPVLDADSVRRYVATKWPQAMQSPLAEACATAAAADEADRAVEFASLQARATDAVRRALHADALDHARACMNACGGWTVETLGHNIESAFGDELDADECDAIARKALGR